MITKIKNWFRKLLLKWAKGIEIEEYNDMYDDLRKQYNAVMEALQRAKDSVTWLREDNEKMIEEKNCLTNPVTITAEIDLNSSPAWKNLDEFEAVAKLKQSIIKQFGEACMEYMSVFKTEDNCLTCTVNVVKYDR
ncbi:MAG: hypothetical protein MJ225_04810 [Bacilli bacterium]|nr:hypothetical protein [Bacilli bacterium]